MEKENYSAKLIYKEMDKTEVGELVNKIKTAENKTQVAMDICLFGYKYVEKLKEKNLEVYQNNVAPKMVRLDVIKRQLEAEGLTKENEDKLLEDLIVVEKEIKEEAKEYHNSIIEKMGEWLGGIAIGATAVLAIQHIWKLIARK